MVVEFLSMEGGRDDCVVASEIWLETPFFIAGGNIEEVEFGLGKRLVVTGAGTSVEVVGFVVGSDAVLTMGFDFVEDTYVFDHLSWFPDCPSECFQAITGATMAKVVNQIEPEIG